ncbi:MULTISPECIES: BON domain-containing protein [Buttiauxella]|jgi:osmotically-inducible protein OsmY|uniref:Osmotically-inducible protein Y n=1 Tax=Buttiauxella ferragutiae ATCC 51602 TaxID=1354252 RepID=A0ABX2W5L8_9ENTR|nr:MULTISPECIES: BON domain-containing protein [Buttiauxella]AYN26347.1 BON domain-containing protein [Buttiauxella sp. 3AFRM03]MCE0827670.1 BON domain-containing protein [Buttiauxella ferragutiae]OAT26192.1 osmotically-inducible protein Y [Buttiauxella ferragutiae ATCC 51602]TDN54668.1 BON domain-containing protein [Buttiauxella sp. JUb87]UNK63354.1 BON domain-containing protein [Buttiauxella ferragutiae]
MKNRNIMAIFCAIALAATTLTGCAGSSKQESTGGYIDDTVITTKVKSTLLAEKSLKSTDISVVTFKGRVQLSGFVASSAEANKAVALTKTVKGVRMVENDLLVK